MKVEGIRWKYGDDVRYAYAVGVIRVLETRLLSRERIDRAADASDVDEVLRILAETHYSEYLTGLTGPDEHESFLETAHQKTLNLLHQLTKDPPVTDLFSHRFDFHNLKVGLKEKFGKQEMASAYVSLGSIPFPMIKTAVMEEDFSALPLWLRQPAELVVREFPERQDPKWIDMFIDQRMYRLLVVTCQRERSLFLYNIVRKEIDLINILSFFRIRQSGQERGLFLESFIDGGSLFLQFFLPLFDDPPEAVPGRFAFTPYRDLVEEGWASLASKGSFVAFDRLSKDLVMRYLREANLIAFGIEPLIAYVHAKENELKMIRTVLIGKLNRLQSNLIKESLPRVHL